MSPGAQGGAQAKGLVISPSTVKDGIELADPHRLGFLGVFGRNPTRDRTRNPVLFPS